MKLLIALFATYISLITATKPDCNVVVVNSKNYEKQVLKNVHQAYQLTLDPATNTLYFSYSTEANSKTVQKIGYIDLNTNVFGEVTGINGGFATAVDTTKHIVYFGGNDGLYTFDFAKKEAKNLGITNYSIWQMFFCPIHGLFFTTADTEKPYVYKDDLVNSFNDLNDTKTRLIAVGEHHDIFFANSSGVFIFNHHKGKVYDLGDYNVNGFTRDASGKLYFSSPDGFYSVKEKDRKMNKLVSVSGGDSIWGAAFDKDGNIVYSTDESILKLVPTDKTC